MAYNRFRLMIIIRLLFLVGTLVLFILLFMETEQYITMALVAAAIVAQFISLIRYLDRSNRQLARFLDSIQHEDYTQTFEKADGDASFQELNAAFKAVMDKIRQTRTEREHQRRYLQTVIQHVGIGLIAFRPDGHVELANNAVRGILRVHHLKNIHTLASFSPELVQTLLQMRSGEKKLVRVQLPEDQLQLALASTVFKQRDQLYTLVTIQDIRMELEEKEMEAWQKLTRVLTHEIMNSVTPIASLTSTVTRMLGENDNVPQDLRLDEETVADIHAALNSIQRRSEGLLHFVETYRSLTRIPRPNFQIFNIHELFDRVERLLMPQLEEKSIPLGVEVVPPNLTLTADPDLMEQVLLNLLLNAAQALDSTADPRIRLSARLDAGGRVNIQVSDNGPGILDEVMEKVFIPFFTTKPSGSGIGLSLSRQIMRLHGGTISVRSRPNEGAIFTLRF
ncbi:MAG: ATP-binding protein [Acidobacteria bacterium]|nr:ATP-binding protein [Acidobacteriota bacterium]